MRPNSDRAWDRAEARTHLDEALVALALPTSPRTLDRLLDLCELLASWARRISLTAHRTPGSILDRLVLDAAALANVLPSAACVADLGSGAGFPGLPLAILFPERRFTLVEARERKHHFQREAIRRLDLENVQALLGRSEALEPQRHEGVVAQAMARPREVVPLLLPWADAGAWLAIPGGQSAPLVEAVPGVSGSEIRRYRVAATGVERTVWIGRREATLL